MDQIKVIAPATVANVGCGFDVLGFAVNEPGDTLLMRRTERPGVVINSIEGDGGKLTLDPTLNAVSSPILKFLEHIGSNAGFELDLIKGVPPSGGMGSSSASSVVGVFAANALLGEPLPVEKLLPFAMEGERVACGVAHADNVAPALLGGFVVIRSYDPLDAFRIPFPEDMYCTLIHPDVKVRTEDARKILQRRVELSKAVAQWGNVAGLVAGLMSKDLNLIGRSLQDHIVEPIRSILIPGFGKAKAAALNAGALGCSISGSGPSLFALSADETTANQVAQVMKAEFAQLEIESQTYVSKINSNGPVIVN